MENKQREHERHEIAFGGWKLWKNEPIVCLNDVFIGGAHLCLNAAKYL